MPSLNDDGFDLPLSKRQRRNAYQEAGKMSHHGSRIFAPFRTLGLVSPTSVPFTCVRLGKATFQITTCVGRSLQTYDLRRGLSLVFISRPQTPEAITATVAWQDKVFAAWGNLRPGSSGGIWVFKRGKKMANLEMPQGFVEPIQRLLVFGSWIVGCSKKSIQVWKNLSYEHYTTLESQGAENSSGEQFYTGLICNMPTYINKILVGRCDGNVDIWNVKTGKLLHSMLPPFSKSGAVTAIQPTPVLSLVAIAYQGGALVIRNVESGRFILQLQSDSSHSHLITSIAFRNDDLGAGEDGRMPGSMATASLSSGDIKLWDLNTGRITGTLRNSHRISADATGTGVTHIEFLDGQPLLVSTGRDNSLKTWIFDEAPFSPTPRLLHSRKGHSSSITALQFLPAASDGSEFGGKWLLSASKDCSLWGFSVRKDSQNSEISQGNVESKAKKVFGSGFGGRSTQNEMHDELKVPEITCIACSLNRDGGMGTTTSGPIWANSKVAGTDASSKTGWESIVTGHRADKFARTWFWGKRKAGRWIFETGDGTVVKSVAISQCGTFALVGSAGGSIDMFNLQSGSHRQSFPPRLSKKNAPYNTSMGHTKAITGLMMDNLNQTVISSSLDGRIKFWDFTSAALVYELDWHPMTCVTGLCYNATSDLIAFSCDDLAIRVIDIETRKTVREFWGCAGQINDVTFSSDGRWLIAASMDSVVRVWDLPTGHLIDLFRVPTTCTALTMSLTGEFLATAHADATGISLWSNRGFYAPISTQSVDESSISNVEVPTVSGEGGKGALEAAFAENQVLDEARGPSLTTEQLTRDMITLSVVPKSKWRTLLHLDLIKERNKPKEPCKATQKAPFFLPSASEEGRSDQVDLDLLIESTIAERSKMAKIHSKGTDTVGSSAFVSLLKSGALSNNFDAFIEHLKYLSPAKTDLEIRSLNPRVQEGRSELTDFVLALSSQLKSRRDFELVNAWMAVFLRSHADIAADCVGSNANEYSSLREALIAWNRVQQEEGQRLSGLVGYCRGVLGFLRSSR